MVQSAATCGEGIRLSDIITVTQESGKRVSYTVSLLWCLKVEGPFVFKKYGAFRAFRDLKDRLVAAVRNNDVKSSYSIGGFQFIGITLSEK